MASVRTLVLALSVCAHAGALGAESIRLPRDPALSPDGTQLAFSWAGDVWIAPSTGGAARPLTRDPADDRNPHFSPDGRTIAFTSNRTGAPQIFVMTATGGAAEQKTFHSEGFILDGWYPDGSAFLARGNRDHFHRPAQRFLRVDALARAAEEVLFDGYGADGSLAPDGSSLLFTREDTNWFRKGYRGSQASQIWRFDRDTHAFTKLLADEEGFRTPLWKPDGGGFYYVGQQSGSFNLWECAADGTQRRRLTQFDDDAVMMPALSRDGRVLVFRHLFDFYRYEPGGGQGPERLDLVNAAEPVANEILRRSLDDASDVAFSEDGLEIALIAGGDLYVMDTELREPRRVTETPELEHSPVFTKDGGAILYVSEQGGQSDIWRAERENADAWWWQNDRFVHKRLTEDAAVEDALDLSPDGSLIAFLRDRGDIMVMDENGKGTRRLVESSQTGGFDWSPDGKWIAYSAGDGDFNYDVWILPVDLSRPAVNVSVHPDNDGDPVWSPDGKLLAFTGRRSLDDVDIHYVWLARKDAEKDKRDRTLEKAVEKMKKARGDGARNKGAEPEPDAEKNKEKAAAGAEPKAEGAAEDGEAKEGDGKNERAGRKKEPKLPEVVIDVDRLDERVERITIPDSTEGNLFFADESRLAFNASVDGKNGVYSVTFPDELKPKFVASGSVAQARWLRGPKQVVLRHGGTPAQLDKNGSFTDFGFRVLHEVRTADRYRAAFDVAWRLMRDNFYDERLGKRNWDAIRRKYIDVAAASVDGPMFQEVVSLMLGELNGSHLGFTSFEGGYRSGLGWTDTTAHLGVRFDPAYQGPGLRVRDVIKDGPADQDKSRIRPDEIVLAVDGVTVDPSMDLTLVLNGTLDRDVRVHVRAADAVERDVTIRPMSYGAVRRRLYDMWIDANVAAVTAASGGTLGYLHIEGMDWSSFQRFEQSLYRVGHGKDGLVIDVRGNGGGSTADHLLTALTQPEHAVTVGRGGGEGYPQDRRVYASWSKPIIVLCDQNSFSNAEIFAHAIKTLGRGKLVGVRTAGGVISTGASRVMDVGLLRMPFRGWFLLADGEDMERNGARPDVELWDAPEDLPSGRDPQLAKAVELLLDDVREWKTRPRPALRKASER